MQLSHEQLAIIESKGIVNSGAGCSKATTVEYARRRPGQKILYIAFNKSIRVEGEKRFLKAGVSNVKIETAHSLAYVGMHVRDRYTLCNGGNMKANEVADLCGIKPTTAGGIKYLILAKHILNCLNLYLNSDTSWPISIIYQSVRKVRSWILQWTIMTRFMRQPKACCCACISLKYRQAMMFT